MSDAPVRRVMSYRDLISALGHDLRFRRDLQLDAPVSLALRDAQGELCFGHLVAFGVGPIPESATGRDDPMASTSLELSSWEDDLYAGVGDDAALDDTVVVDVESFDFAFDETTSRRVTPVGVSPAQPSPRRSRATTLPYMSRR